MNLRELKVVVAALCIGSACSHATGEDFPFDDPKSVCEAIVQLHNTNKAKLTKAALVWSKHTHENNFIPGRVVDLGGEYEMWIDGSRAATRYHQDLMYDDGKRGRGGQRSAYVGKEFRVTSSEPNPSAIAIANEPDYHHGENYLQVIGWTVPLTIEKVVASTSTRLSIEKVSLDQVDGDRVLSVLMTAKDGGSIKQLFCLDKGGCLIREEMRDEKGRVYLTDSRQLQLFEGDLWMPVVAVGRTTSPETNDLLLENTYKLDLARSQVGPSSTIDQAIFDIPITPEMRVKDHRAGKSFSYTGQSSPLSVEELKNKIDLAQKEVENKGRAPAPAGRKWIWSINLVVVVFLAVAIVYRRYNRTTA